MSRRELEVAVEKLGLATVPVADLRRFPGNSRIHDKGAIRRSVDKFGQLHTLTVRVLDDGGYVILGGNGTTDQLEATGHAEAEVSLVRCTDAEAEEINMALNRSGDLAHDDPQLINAQAARLLALGGDLEVTSWDEDSLAALLAAGDGKNDPLPDPGDAPSDPMQDRWGVIVECATERQQSDLLAQLGDEGYAVRALMS
jgi:ParB-like chromosome segregation protein Spo0J